MGGRLTRSGARFAAVLVATSMARLAAVQPYVSTYVTIAGEPRRSRSAGLSRELAHTISLRLVSEQLFISEAANCVVSASETEVNSCRPCMQLPECTEGSALHGPSIFHLQPLAGTAST